MLKIKNLTKVYGDKKAVATNRKRSMSVGIAEVASIIQK